MVSYIFYFTFTTQFRWEVPNSPIDIYIYIYINVFSENGKVASSNQVYYILCVAREILSESGAPPNLLHPSRNSLAFPETSNSSTAATNVSQVDA